MFPNDGSSETVFDEPDVFFASSTVFFSEPSVALASAAFSGTSCFMLSFEIVGEAKAGVIDGATASSVLLLSTEPDDILLLEPKMPGVLKAVVAS